MKILATVTRIAPPMVALVVVLLATTFATADTQPTWKPGEPATAQPAPALSQGCVNQGGDLRVGAPVVCWAQRKLSWRSSREPHFLLLGRAEGTNVGIAWPPYLVVNAPEHDGRWRMFRIGFRYDRTWRGYIFPTAAWKSIDSPLQY